MRGGTELRVIDLASKQETLAGARADCRCRSESARPIAWSPDGKWIAYFTAGARGFTNVFVVPAAGGEAQAGELPRRTATPTLVSWSPDGTFLPLRHEPAHRGRAARARRSVPRTPRFREDQFRDLFHEENRPQPAAAGQPATGDRSATASTTDAAATSAKPATQRSPKPVEIVFDDIRQRAQRAADRARRRRSVISPDGKTLLLIAGAAGQQNLYIVLARRAGARAGRSPGSSRPRRAARRTRSFTPDSKEVFYLDDGRIQASRSTSASRAPIAVTAELDVDFAQEKMEVVPTRRGRYLRDNFFDPEVQRRRLERGARQRTSRASPARGRRTRCAGSCR